MEFRTQVLLAAANSLKAKELETHLSYVEKER
jgi:hypothetical protein